MKNYITLISLLLLSACAHIPTIHETSQNTPEETNKIQNLRSSVAMIGGAGNNHARRRAIESRLADYGCEDYTQTEWIDWFTFQRNVLVDIPGQTNQVIYITAHYDKADINPLTVVSLMLNGMLDDLVGLAYFTQGEVDNGSGVAVALELAKTLKKSTNHYSYRVLLCGAEESGLRGSRAHVSGLPKVEKDKIALAINLDVVGVKDCANCLTIGTGSPILETNVIKLAESLNIPLEYKGKALEIPSDYKSFRKQSFLLDFFNGIMYNLPGGFLPQRSWFTKSHEAITLNFSAVDTLGVTDDIAGMFLLPVGNIHGPRDNASKIDAESLYEQYEIIYELLRNIESGEIKIDKK